MRHKGVGKETTRLKVIEAAGRQFRKFGYSGVGIDALAKGADVTSGAIYGHFGSKAGVFDVVLMAGLDEVINGLTLLQAKCKDKWIDEFVDYYLGASHRGDIERVCAMASLTSEVIHFGSEMQEAYEQKMQKIAGLIAVGLNGDPESNLEKAWTILSLLTGAVNIARAMQTEQLADYISSSVKYSIKAILK